MKTDLKTILQLIGTVFALLMTFLGGLYWLGGEVLLAGFIGVVLVTILYFVVEQLRRRKTEIRKQRFSAVSILLWAGYVVVSVPLSLLLVHALNVEIHHRTEVQQAAAAKTAALGSMVKAYDALAQDEINSLQMVLKPLLASFSAAKPDTAARRRLMEPPFLFSTGVLDNVSASSMDSDAQLWMSARKARFDKASTEVKQRNSAYTKATGAVFTDWHRLQVPLAYAKLDTLVMGNLRALQTSYRDNTSRVGKFEYELPQVPMLMAEPIALWQRTQPYALILAVVAFHLLLLLPYLLEQSFPPPVGDEEGGVKQRFPEAFEL
jgi:hypothetical protein